MAECSIKVRNGYIDVWRLVASFVIVFFHSWRLDGVDNYPYMGGKIFVEFFFFVTGYYTIYHLKSNPNMTIRDILLYTYRKYCNFWSCSVPFTVILLLIRYIFFHKKNGILRDIVAMTFLIKGENIDQLWYLTALLPIIPLIMYVLSRTKTVIHVIISFFVFCFYYFILQFYPSHFPVFYCRAVAGMAGGIMVYYTSVFFKRYTNSSVAIGFGNIALIISLIMGYINILDFRLAVTLFVLGLSFILASEKQTNNYILQRIAYCGEKYSFPVYVVHMSIVRLIAFLSKNVFHLDVKIQYFFI